MSRRPYYEHDTYESRQSRHVHRNPDRDYDYADYESRHHPRAPEPPRVRERARSPPNYIRERHYQGRRSPSAGPLAVRGPRGREEGYEFIDHEMEREAVPGLGVRSRERVVEKRSPPRMEDVERENLVIRRREREGEGDVGMGRGRADYGYHRDSYERERSRNRGGDREEIILRRDERDRGNGRGRGRGDVEREEIIIRRREESSSPSESSENSPIGPPPIRAPPIHQDVITHHRHLDHGYEVVHRPRPPPPSETASGHDEDEIEIRRRRERNGRTYDDEIIIDRESNRRRSRENFAPVPSPPRRRPSPRRDHQDKDELIISHRTSRGSPPNRERNRDMVILRDRDEGIRDRREAADIREEADYYNRHANESGRIGEAYNGATKDWAIVDVPPGTKRVTMDGVGGASQEVSWQRYNGVRRSKFLAEGDEYASDRERVDRNRGRIGRRYIGVKDKRDGLWTEITKDLVVKEAIERRGYDYEETEYFYYIMAYMKYDDVADLVALSEEYRHARRERIREIQRERATLTPPPPPPLPAPLPPPPGPHVVIERSSRPVYDDAEEERIVEREVYVDGGQMPPSLPIGRRRW
ncbi:hypothetical protein FQN55_007310 [Onygenales sp. PD_40]|nr:hypothetical protein FQN55_007310 [Onygenales sp. PD_40]